MFKKPENKKNFIQMEESWLKKWYSNGIVKKYINKNNNSDKYFSFLDGPITANNPMGVHHAWGRTYKDLWQKFYNLLGYKQRFHNGFDCQGLWVEVGVEKDLGITNKREIENLVDSDKEKSIEKFVNLCKERVIKYAKVQTEQSKRLGYFMDWDNSYYTMSDENNYMIWHFLKTCHLNGWIYKGRDVVPWCPRCQTAISQHEILTEDYQEIVHQTIFFKLPIEGKDFSVVVWTTTPWTIPGNTALAVNTQLKYCLFRHNQTGEKIVCIDPDEITDPEVKKFLERALGNSWEKLETLSGDQLVGLKYKSLFDYLSKIKQTAEKYENLHTIIAENDYVTADKGTGILHLAPAAGEEDFAIAKKHNLPVIEIIDEEANYLNDLDDLSGLNAKNDPKIILSRFESNLKYLLKIQKIRHRYPVCWRCKTELVWKIAEEWYISMDKPGKDGRTLRQRMINTAKKIKWLPEFGLQRELDWLEKMHDWLISKKNRYWGLSLPIWECSNCSHFEVIGSKEELKEKAVVGFEHLENKSPHKPQIDKVKINCPNCGALVNRISDVGNPWLDAGIVPFSTIKHNNQGEPLYITNREEWQKWFPADFITESFPGQFKNWFYALIAMSTVLEDTNPYKTVLGFGTLLAEDGRPMHKSWGNSIEFNEGASKMGVDVIRWMYLKNNPYENLLFGYKKADEVRKTFYLKLWNIYQFFLTYVNLDNPDQQIFDNLEYNKLTSLDKWILQRLRQTADQIKLHLKNYAPNKAAEAIESLVDDISNWYIRLSRDRVWTNSTDTADKDYFYQTFYYLLIKLSIILSPFLPFITEEIYTTLTGNESVHLEFWPEFTEYGQDEKILSEFELIKQIIEAGRRIRKEHRLNIRQPLASAEILAPKQYHSLIKSFASVIQSELNFKQLNLTDAKETAINYDFNLTEELKLEGRLRQDIRKLQLERKKLGLSPEDKIKVQIPKEYEKFQKDIKQKLNAESITIGESFTIIN
ncbi:MAG: isoleucine--tRNA ligase [Patescibacteria group bacterium]|nr:MAG: isoleucine--tRNA ligase [Patescibacteria group bacterium]